MMAKGGLWLGIGISVVLAIGSIALVAVVVVHWPADHFKHHVPGSRAEVRRHILASVGRNVGGGLLILLGLVMALPGIPGQGLLTILIGVMFLDIPGKRKLEQRLVQWPRVLSTINGLRRRYRRPELVFDPTSDEHDR